MTLDDAYAVSACLTRSSHARISPILLLVRLILTLAARRDLAVERSIAILPWFDNRFHLGVNFRASLTSSVALFFRCASSLWIFSLARFVIGTSAAFAISTAICVY